MILWCTYSDLAWNAVKRDILELDKAHTEAPLLQETKAEHGELKQQGWRLHAQIYIPAQRSTLDS